MEKVLTMFFIAVFIVVYVVFYMEQSANIQSHSCENKWISNANVVIDN